MALKQEKVSRTSASSFKDPGRLARDRSDLVVSGFSDRRLKLADLDAQGYRPVSADVLGYLEAHRELYPLLAELAEISPLYFDVLQIGLYLTEQEDGSQKLLCQIQTEMDGEQASEVMTRFRLEWWIQASYAYQNSISVRMGW